MIGRRPALAGVCLVAGALAGHRGAASQPGPPGRPAALPAPGPAPAHADFGPVLPPRPAPALALRTHEGRDTDLRRLLDGRACALQLMFTGCSATCPIQGAVFADVARRLGEAGQDGRSVRLLSVSIDPLGDSPAALRAWLQQHGPSPLWSAAVPRQVEGGQQMLDFLRAGRDGPDPHTGQVHVFDRRGRWIFKSADLPSSREIVAWLGRAAALR